MIKMHLFCNSLRRFSCSCVYISMKTTKTIILFFFLSFSLGFSIDFDLEEITLPYDNLDITDLSVTNKTIICRAENKIYRSEDDGVTWEIVFDAPKKINHFYTLNPHTIFVVGDSGMVYRTMDYGDTWINLSVISDLNLVRIAAKDYSDCMVLAGKDHLIHISRKGKTTTEIKFNLGIALFDIMYRNGKYSFAGETVITDRYKDLMTLNLFLYTVSGDDILVDDIGVANYNKINYLKFFNMGEIQYISLFLDKKYCVYGLERIYIDDGPIGYINKSKIKSINLLKNDLFVFMENTEAVAFDSKEILHFNPYEKIDSTIFKKLEFNLPDGTNFLNSFNTNDSIIYISGNNSKIYKMHIKETISSIETALETELIIQSDNQIEFNYKLHNISIFNYLGLLIETVDNKYVDLTQYKTGVYLVTYKYQNQYYTKKILVGY